MQFKVPQFLDIEDKIFGPFTFRQFVYLAGGAGLCFTLYKLLGLLLGAIPILAIGGLSAALTFYRPNNKPFIEMLQAGFKYFTQGKLYIWKKRANKMTNDKFPMTNAGKSKAEAAQSYVASLNSSRLKDLAWSLDVLDLGKKSAGSPKLMAGYEVTTEASKLRLK